MPAVGCCTVACRAEVNVVYPGCLDGIFVFHPLRIDIPIGAQHFECIVGAETYVGDAIYTFGFRFAEKITMIAIVPICFRYGAPEVILRIFIGVRAFENADLDHLAADGDSAAVVSVSRADVVYRSPAHGRRDAGHGVLDRDIAAGSVLSGADARRTISALRSDGAALDDDIAAGQPTAAADAGSFAGRFGIQRAAAFDRQRFPGGNIDGGVVLVKTGHAVVSFQNDRRVAFAVDSRPGSGFIAVVKHAVDIHVLKRYGRAVGNGNLVRLGLSSELPGQNIAVLRLVTFGQSRKIDRLGHGYTDHIINVLDSCLSTPAAFYLGSNDVNIRRGSLRIGLSHKIYIGFLNESNGRCGNVHIGDRYEPFI